MTTDTTARAGHTPTPWAIGNQISDYGNVIRGPHLAYIAKLGENVREYNANAAFIVQACNSFDAMRDALKEAERFLDYFAEGRTSFVGAGTPKSCLAQIRAALALANGAS